MPSTIAWIFVENPPRLRPRALRSIPPFAPAASWCARTTDASTMHPLRSPRNCKALRACAQTPASTSWSTAWVDRNTQLCLSLERPPDAPKKTTGGLQDLGVRATARFGVGRAPFGRWTSAQQWFPAIVPPVAFETGGAHQVWQDLVAVVARRHKTTKGIHAGIREVVSCIARCRLGGNSARGAGVCEVDPVVGTKKERG